MSGYNVEHKDQTLKITLAGDLTAPFVPALQAELKAALDGGATGVTFDLSGTAMIDSSGIGLLIATANSLSRKSGRLEVVNVSADVMRLLQSMRLAGRLNVSAR